MLRKCKIAEVLHRYSEYMKLNSTGKLNWRRWLKNKINWFRILLKICKVECWKTQVNTDLNSLLFPWLLYWKSFSWRKQSKIQKYKRWCLLNENNDNIECSSDLFKIKRNDWIGVRDWKYVNWEERN